MYRICYDSYNILKHRTETFIIATACSFEVANQLLREYESKDIKTEYYIMEVKNEKI